MLEFRPHHFMCTLGFTGKGYSREFVQNLREIAEKLRKNPDGDQTQIRVVAGCDHVCSCCPHCKEGQCDSAAVPVLDAAHSKILKIKTGDILTWNEAKHVIKKNMTDTAFHDACASCYWKKLGACHSALVDLRAHQTSGKIPGLLSVILGALIFLNTVSFSAFCGEPSAISPSPSPLPSASPSAVPSPTPKPTAKPAPKSTPSPVLEKSIETLKVELFKLRRSKKARTLKQAYTALKESKFNQTRKLVSGLRTDELFADYALYLTIEAYRLEASAQLTQKKYKSALENAKKALPLFPQIEIQQPYSPMIKKIPENMAQTELLIADSHYGIKQWKSAQGYYERAFQRLTSISAGLGSLRPETLEKYTAICTKNPSPICQAWTQKFTMTYAKNSEELKAIGKNFPEIVEKGRPQKVHTRYNQNYRAPDLDQTAIDAAMTFYLSEKYSEATKEFQRFIDEFPRSPHRYRARYWLGQSLTHEQEHEKARKVYEDLLQESPLTYYGLLASVACGKTMDSYFGATLPSGLATDPLLQPWEVVRLKRAEYFVVEGAKEFAAQELRDLRPRDYASNSFLLYLAMLNHETGNHSMSFQVVEDMIRRSYDGIFTSYGLRLVFPVVEWELIQKYASQNKLDPILVLSLMKQESAFNFGAVSSSGAVGAMQLMPATAVDTEATVKRADLVEVETNIRIGTKYLKRLLNKFNGNIAFSLAGYNAGPNAVDRWIREGRSKQGLLEFIESIPYRETRDYVSGIIRNYYWYSKNLNGEPFKSLNYFWNLYGPPELPSVPAPTDSQSGEEDL